MKCNRCGDFAETAADIMNCKSGCQDGTAQQLPAGTDPATTIAELARSIPGLANRFVAGSAPANDVEPENHSEPEAAAPEQPEGFIAKVKRAVSRKKK